MQTVSKQLLGDFNKNKSIKGKILHILFKKTQKVCFGDYQILRCLGQGAFGEVFQARHVHTGKLAAFKIIDKVFLFEKYTCPETHKQIERYLDVEEQCMRECSSAHVVKLYEAHQDQKEKILITEYCQGGSLDDLIIKQGSLTEQEAIYVLQQMVLGLAEIHRNKIMHRDLKPDNILLHEGVFKICDFGLARKLEHLEEVGNFSKCGTKTTMAPEVKQSQESGLKADVWSLGMTFFLSLYPSSSTETKDVEKFQAAMMMLHIGKGFNFKTKSGPLSKQAADFLNKTIVYEHEERIDWQQMLSHQIFQRASKSIPESMEFSTKSKTDSSRMSGQEVEAYSPALMDKINSSVVQDKPKCSQNPQQTGSSGKKANPAVFNRQHLQCKKAEFILNEIIVKLEYTQMLDTSKRSHVELMFLMARRCKCNLEEAIRQINEKCSAEVAARFEEAIEKLKQRVDSKFQFYDRRVREMEDKVSSMVVDFFSKLVKKKSFQEKEQYIGQFQGCHFTREQQINQTYKNYILQAMNQLKGNQEDEQKMKNILKSYREINALTWEAVKDRGFDEVVRAIIRSKK